MFETIECREQFELKNITTFKIGGTVKRVFFPKCELELVEILENTKGVAVFGNFSNVLVSSFGFDGDVISTTRMDSITVEGNRIIASAGVKGPKLAKVACENGLSGLEFLIGFPSTIGGAVCMNASAHGQAISEVIDETTLLNAEEGFFRLTREEMEFDYRKSICHQKSLLVLNAEFLLEKKSSEKIQSTMNEFLEFRKRHQPMMTLGNAGSIFKNPKNNSAGKLLDECNMKGSKMNGAKVWENHANFIVNSDNATSLDVLELMLKMYEAVKEKFDIELEPEIRFLGGNNEREIEICKILYQ
ncbi:MAG: UDP-N-acetylmuramate dehydrogenase [Candidatus Gastranaerophilales bacterium]